MWDTAGNWTPSGEPATNDAVIVDGGAVVTLTNRTAYLASLTLDGATLKFKEPVQCLVADAVAELRAEAVAIQNGAKVTHVRQEESSADWTSGGKGEWKIDGRVYISCGSLSLDAKSSIIGDGLGYYCHPSVSTAMCGPNSFAETGNGGHGGYGYYVYPWRTDVTTHPCGPYDDPIHPVMPGTSGSRGDSTSNPGQAGGGAIRIAATGDVTVNGTISANSQRTGGYSLRGGAGGSVWISCRTISGGGIVRANGSMNTGNGNSALCGGGGCVAIHYDAAAQAALDVPDLRISGTVDFYSNVMGLGDVGTVYLTDTRFLRDEFNATRGVGGGNVICGDWSGWSPASLTVSSVWIRLPSGACKQLHLTGGIAVSGFGGRLDFGGEQFFMIQRAITPLIATQTVSVVVDGDVTLSDKGRLSVFAAATNGLAETWASLDVKGDLSIAANSVLELFSHPTNGASCHVSCENLTVAANGWVTAGGHGFGGNINGKDMNAYGPGGALSASGGAYGGFSNGHHPYGDWKKPLFAGSGGSRGDNWQNGSQAGGVVYLSVKGSCEMNGTLSADANGAPGSSAGSGSGGSVYVTAKTFTGKGRVTANGGNGQQDNNTGGGGRIALVCTDPAAQAALAAPAVYTFDARTYGGDSGVRVLTSDFGSLYLSDTKMASDAFVANKIQHCQLYLDDWTDFALDRISQTNTFVRLVNAPSPLTIDSIFINNGWLEFGGDATHQRFNCRRPYRTGRGIDICVAGDVTLTNSAQLTVRGGITNGNAGVINYSLAKTNKVDKASMETALSGTVTIGGQLTVHKNAWVCPDSHPFDGGSVRFETKRLDIREGGGFDANARGWTTAQSGEKGGHGPGRGTSTARGGGYGGPAYDGKVYGSAPMPLLPGSGSGCNINGSPCGAGGGLVWLTVRRHASILGTLRASGETTWGTFASGGSGGAICLRVPSFDCTTNTLFTAGGGGANWDGQVGAGGRIAVYTLSGTVSKDVKMSVNAGDSSASRRGTIHIGALPRGMMVILR